jgi:DNA-binding CsgD family transcriptional regulator/tetratricopeptide (TPR) repeat protein
VFAGGWTLDAAQAVCTDVALPVTSIEAVLERLVTRSLVLVEHHNNGSARYWLLETVREYARERLEASEEGTGIRRRHAAWILELAELAPEDAINPAHASTLDREQEEVRIALGWAISRPEVELGLRLATGAYALWSLRGHYAEGRTWLERLLRLAEPDSTQWAIGARLSLGRLLMKQGEYAGAEAASQVALNAYTAAGDQLGIASAMYLAGDVELRRGNLAPASTLLGEAAEHLRQLAHPREFGVLVRCATVALELGEVDRALELAADIEERGQAWQPQLASAWGLFLRASVAANSGDAALAERLFLQVLELQKALAYYEFRVVLRIELGHTLLDRAEVDRARTAFADAALAAYDAGLRIRLCRALDGIARSAAVGQPENAVRLAAASAGMRTTLGIVPWPREQRRIQVWLPGARHRLGEREYEAAWSSGETLSVDEAVALARVGLDRPSATPGPNGSRFTPREADVAALLARGFSTTEIAVELVISAATVRVHLDHIMAKLGLHSRTQVAVWVREHAAAMVLPPTSSARG